jgi:hypothetical protein
MISVTEMRFVLHLGAKHLVEPTVLPTFEILKFHLLISINHGNKN